MTETCARCGAFGELQPLGGVQYCSTCAARPDVGVADKFRAQHLGRRDAATWVIGILSPFTAWVAIVEWGEGHPKQVGVYAVLAAAQALFWLGVPWARPLPVIACLIGGGLAVTGRPIDVAWFLWQLVFAFGAWISPMSRLFFRADVPAEQLVKLSARLENNRLSHAAYVLAGASLLMPIFWPFAMGYTFAALARADLAASLRVGHGFARQALVLCVLTPVLWGGLPIAVHLLMGAPRA
jgi:hypothetical protein